MVSYYLIPLFKNTYSSYSHLQITTAVVTVNLLFLQWASNWLLPVILCQILKKNVKYYLTSDLVGMTLLFLALPPREILLGGTRLFWGPGDRLRRLSKLRIWDPIKPLVNFKKCFTPCAAECPDKICFIQSSDKHNQLMLQGVTCLSCFIQCSL